MTTVYQPGTNRESIPLSDASVSERVYEWSSFKHKASDTAQRSGWYNQLFISWHFQKTDGYSIHHSSGVLSCKCPPEVVGKKAALSASSLKSTFRVALIAARLLYVSISTSSTSYWGIPRWSQASREIWFLWILGQQHSIFPVGCTSCASSTGAQERKLYLPARNSSFGRYR